MRISKLMMWMLLAALAITASTQAFAYDAFEADFATCTQGNDQAAVVAACPRLIDNAAKENSMVGMFYGLRAANNTDKAQNCSDARKSFELADDDAIKNLSQKLIHANC